MTAKKMLSVGLMIGFAIALVTCLSGTALAVGYTWDGGTGNWDAAGGHWGVGVAPAGIADTGTISSGVAGVNVNLGTGDADRPALTINGTGVMEYNVPNVNTSGYTITVDGGTIRRALSTGPGESHTSTDTYNIVSTMYVVNQKNERSLTFNGTIQDIGNSHGQLVASWIAGGNWIANIVLATANTYSGGTVVNAGNYVPYVNGQGPRVWHSGLNANATGSLGTGPVTVNDGGWLALCANSTTPAPITVLTGGIVALGQDATAAPTSTSGHTIILDGGTLLRGGYGYNHDSRTSTDTIKVQGVGTGHIENGYNEAGLTLAGLIEDGATPGKLVYQWCVATDGAQDNWGAPIYVTHAGNTYSGGTEVCPTANRVNNQWSDGWADRLYVQATGCLGTGPVTVDVDAYLNLIDNVLLPTNILYLSSGTAPTHGYGYAQLELAGTNTVNQAYVDWDGMVGTQLAAGTYTHTELPDYIIGSGWLVVLGVTEGAPVPEPAGLGLIGLALLAIRRRRA